MLDHPHPHLLPSLPARLATDRLDPSAVNLHGLREDLRLNEFEHLLWIQRNDGAIETVVVNPVIELSGSDCARACG